MVKSEHSRPDAPSNSGRRGNYSGLRPRRWWRRWIGADDDYDTNVHWRRVNMRAFQTAFLVLTAVVPLAAGAWFVWLDRGASGGPLVLFAYFQVFAVVGFLVCRTRARDLEAEYRTIEFERQLQRDPARSAINLFLKNEVELKRYYEQALRQSSYAFTLGVLCVLGGLGAAAAAATGVALLKDQHSTAQIVVGALGAVGGVLSGAVARVYLGIHRGTVSSLTDFHTRFVATHHLLLANVIAGRISDAQLQDHALQVISAGIAGAGERLAFSTDQT